ncbi:MAG: acetyl-CoA carboxylase carboxyltransferase subunit alpha [Chloroflexota bacterium]|nr:acetyl-CoA carboxylase carboxyltransferase subunit alpha [Chloroflexota bacterium]
MINADLDESTSTAPPAPSAWDRVKLARETERPTTQNYLAELFTNVVEYHGDRLFGDDRALIGGPASFRGRSVMVLGHQGGANTRENIARNFGMPRPEGYRKAQRLMRHAEKFGMPIITFIDTPGADPGINSEERGQGAAIAESLMTMFGIRVPIICTVIAEGGSGGALAIGVGDRLLMLENSIYAVASPEACAAILWKDAGKAAEAAETMRITAADVLRFGIADDVIPEPTPAHEAPREVIASVGERIDQHLNDVLDRWDISTDEGVTGMLEARAQKFRKIGAWRDSRVASLDDVAPDSQA